MTEPRSVLHMIRPRPPGEIGGADLHVVDLAEAQARRGLHVTVLSFGNPEFSALLRTRSVDVMEPGGRDMRAWRRAASRALLAGRPEIVHSHGYRADMIAAVLRWCHFRSARARPAFVMSNHGFIRINLAFRAMTRINEWCLNAADLIVTASASEARRLSGNGHAAVRFIPNGVREPVQAFDGYLAECFGCKDRYVIAFVGRMSPEKRPDLVLHMARIIAPAHPETLFLLVGTGPLGESMIELAARLDIAGQVRFSGLRHDVARLLGGVKVLVCPSETEGTPRAVIEAMAAGVPVVATNVGGLPDLVINGVTGVLVEPGSAERLAAAVTALIANPGKACALGRAAAARARDYFTIERMERQVADAYADAKGLVDGIYEI